MEHPPRTTNEDAAQSVSAGTPLSSGSAFMSTEITFTSDDGTMLFGKLATPVGGGRHPVVVWVQTAEAQTADIRVKLPDGSVIEYLNLYRECLTEMNVAFFSYEGRGIRAGSQPPRYTDIDRAIYNTSTLENKVRDAVAAVQAVRAQLSVDPTQVFLIGSSEGTLLAAETATRLPGQIRGAILAGVLTELREALEFIFTDGVFMQHCQHWDLNNDGIITRDEFEADPKGIRRLIPNVGFEVFDADGDGAYTSQDRRELCKPITDAIKACDWEAIYAHLKPIAGVELPDGWLEDHFAHPPTWAFLSQLDIPVGVFHGEADFSTPVEGARALERMARAEGKTNFEFNYYVGFGHDLGAIEYFRTGVLPEPRREMFQYIQRLIRV